VTGPPPPFPHPSQPSAVAGIGQFQIGVSPIGDIPTFDPWVTLLSQYANSPVITSIILAFNSAMDFTQTMSNFYDMMWNIQTAQGYGLDVWGRIVGVSRTLTIPGTTQYIGFGEAGTSWTGFGQGIWYSGSGLTQNYVLGDADFRRMILAKAATNITDGSIPSTFHDTREFMLPSGSAPAPPTRRLRPPRASQSKDNRILRGSSASNPDFCVSR